MIIGVGVGCYYFFFLKNHKEDEIVVKENQILITAQINQINGNEIVFQKAEEIQISEMPSEKARQQEADGSQSDNQKAEGRMKNAGIPERAEGGAGNGQFSEGTERERRNGQFPEGGMRNGQFSEGINESEPNNNTSNRNQGKENGNEERTMYSLTGEEETMLIPVGTTVTTQLGTTTTFSRLATGDMIKILLEKDENGKDVIVGIWMIG